MRPTSNAESMRAVAAEPRSWHPGTTVLHVILGRHVRDVLLSSATVLSMSLFTIVTIVMIVTTVNSSIASAGTLTRWGSSPVMSDEQSLFAAAGVALPLAPTENVTYPAGWTAEQQSKARYATLPALAD